ncbi:hypothetical protein F511_09662 [Dorcoceras hygrometricum]|uniref:Uncharacterized protein n=1 Tax=Dorcoceras hygrometricum TaxID=472368 RepID=A0A2Z7AFZ2_9LAMI|nr:hypothetical protein F511_09662 [Dorcoceras hygrometricum]
MIDPTAKGKGLLEVISRSNPIEEHCQLVLNNAWEAVSNTMADFDEWIHFRTTVKLRDVSSFEDLTQIKDKFLLLSETEEVAELMQQRSLLMYKMYETEVQKLFDEHLENFKIDVPSINHDYLCFRSFNKELKEIATQHRLSADQEQAQAEGSNQRKEKLDEVVRSIVNIEETSNETREHQAPNNEHQAPNNEHLAHDEQVGVPQNSLSGQQDQPGSGEHPTQLEDPSVHNEDHVNNLGPNPTSEENNTDLQVPVHLTFR